MNFANLEHFPLSRQVHFGGSYNTSYANPHRECISQNWGSRVMVKGAALNCKEKLCGLNLSGSPYEKADHFHDQ